MMRDCLMTELRQWQTISKNPLKLHERGEIILSMMNTGIITENKR